MTDTMDRELGAARRAALDAGDNAAFAARVMARIADTPVWWEVLGRWARPGLAAALLLTALAGLWLGREATAGTGPLDETLAAVTPGSMTALLASDRPPSIDLVLAAPQPH